MIKGVIFDMDGLMFDTERLSFRFWKQAGEKIGYEIPEEMVEGFRGRNRASIGKEILDIYGPEFDFDLFGKYKTQAQIQYIYGRKWSPDKTGTFGAFGIFEREAD